MVNVQEVGLLIGFDQFQSLKIPGLAEKVSVMLTLLMSDFH